MTAYSFVCLDKSVSVSYESLARYLPEFDVTSEIIQLPDQTTLSIEVRVAVFCTRMEPVSRYILVFAFDRTRKNRLLLLTPNMLDEICEYFISQGIANPHDTVLIVGKEGSKLHNQLNSMFVFHNLKKVVVVDFDGKLPLTEFLHEITVDIDRVEARKKALSDPNRADLTSLPVSDKRINDSREQGMRDSVIFANQLLQINGITEPLARSLAEKYMRPLDLMKALGSKDTIDTIFFNNKGSAKKLNSGIKSRLLKVYDFGSDPLDTIK